jgi:hypothetical protein
MIDCAQRIDRWHDVLYEPCFHLVCYDAAIRDIWRSLALPYGLTSEICSDMQPSIMIWCQGLSHFLSGHLSIWSQVLIIAGYGARPYTIVLEICPEILPDRVIQCSKHLETAVPSLFNGVRDVSGFGQWVLPTTTPSVMFSECAPVHLIRGLRYDMTVGLFIC